jgi:hypothetical protein
VAGPVDAAHVVGDVFAEADGFDGVACEVAGGDEAAAEVEEDSGGPGTLRVAGVPEGCEEPL